MFDHSIMVVACRADGRLLICSPQAPLRMQLGAFKPCPRSLWQRTALGLRNVRWPDQVGRMGLAALEAPVHRVVRFGNAVPIDKVH